MVCKADTSFLNYNPSANLPLENDHRLSLNTNVSVSVSYLSAMLIF